MLENYLGYLEKMKNLIKSTNLIGIKDTSIDTKNRSLALSEGDRLGYIGDFFTLIGADVLSKNFKAINVSDSEPESIDYLEFCVYDKQETLDSVKSYYERLKNSLEVSSKDSGDMLKSIKSDVDLDSNKDVDSESSKKIYTDSGVKLSSFEEPDLSGDSLYAKRYRELNKDLEFEDSSNELSLDELLDLLGSDTSEDTDIDSESDEYDTLSDEDLSELGLGNYESDEEESEGGDGWSTDGDGYDELSEEDLADLGIGNYEEDEFDDTESESDSSGDYDELSEEDLADLGLGDYSENEDSDESNDEDDENYESDGDSKISVWEDAFSDGDDSTDLESLDWGNDEGDNTDYSFLDNAWDRLYAKQHPEVSKKDLKGKDAADKLVDISNGLLDRFRRKINETQVS